MTETDTPPFPAGYEKFQLKAAGANSMLSGQIRLNTESQWFKELHGRYITKQRFFYPLSGERERKILEGLLATSGIVI